MHCLHFVQLSLSDSLTALQNLWSLEAAAVAALLDADGAATLFLPHFWSFVFVVRHQHQQQQFVFCRPLSSALHKHFILCSGHGH